MKKAIALILTIFTVNLSAQKVVDITDGDTFQLDDGSKVRMIGINAPEKKDIAGFESKNHLTELILNKEVVLKNDELSSDVDRYGRKLRYVYLDNVNVNLKMILDGYAFAYLTYNFTKSEEFTVAQLESKRIRNGMWGDGQIKEILKEQDSKKTTVPQKAIVFGLALFLILIICGFTLFKK